MRVVKIFEIRLSLQEDLPAAREVLNQWLTASGFPPEQRVELQGPGSYAVSVYFQNRSHASRFFHKLRSAGISKVRVAQIQHKKQDWTTSWKKGWKPFPLARSFQVIPLWQDDRRCPQCRIPLYLDTTNAFGTGLHETTRFTVALMEALSGRFSSFLDIGTGSGILAIAAGKLGCVKVEAFDNDRAAVQVARANLAANGLRGIGVRSADIACFAVKQPFGLVAANLVTPDLVAYQEKICGCVAQGGYLIVSGISLEKYPEFRKAFRPVAFRCLKIIKGKEWSAVLFQLRGTKRHAVE